MGRLISVYTPEFVADITDKMTRYTKRTKIPILKEFCYRNHLPSACIAERGKEHPELGLAIKALLDKKEVDLERMGLSGKIDKTMAVFSLKQLGWRDRAEYTGTFKHNVIAQNINYENYGITEAEAEKAANELLARRTRPVATNKNSSWTE